MDRSPRSIIVSSLLTIALLTLCLFGIRGRRGYNPIKISEAYYCEDSFLNQLGINPAFNLLTSVLDDLRPENKELRLIHKAETDPLTGIYNKGAFYDHVQEKLSSASDSDLFAIYIIDLDDFKSVNDNLGHAMGDQVLSDVAKKLCIVFSDKDCVGRIGGDEFAAFLSLSNDGRKLGRSIIENKAKAICSQIQETYRNRRKSVNVSSSVGVAIYPSAGRDYDTLYKNADKALYKIKENGKNAYCICSDEEPGV